LKGKTAIRGSKYWDGLESRAEGGTIGTGTLSFVSGFSVLFPYVYFVAYKEWPTFEYLDSSYEAIQDGPRDKRKAIYGGPQSTFSPFYRNWSRVL
jgi:hypothetical protein